MDLDISHRSQSRSRDGGGWRTNEKQNIFKKNKNKKRINMKKIKIIKKENKKIKKKENKKERKQEVNN